MEMVPWTESEIFFYLWHLKIKTILFKCKKLKLFIGGICSSYLVIISIEINLPDSNFLSPPPPNNLDIPNDSALSIFVSVFCFFDFNSSVSPFELFSEVTFANESGADVMVNIGLEPRATFDFPYSISHVFNWDDESKD